MPANFKTFEAQSRLLAAVIAAHPGLKLDYKGKSASSVFILSFQLHDPSPLPLFYSLFCFLLFCLSSCRRTESRV